jgi:hypothetical protein
MIREFDLLKFCAGTYERTSLHNSLQQLEITDIIYRFTIIQNVGTLQCFGD